MPNRASNFIMRLLVAFRPKQFQGGIIIKMWSWSKLTYAQPGLQLHYEALGSLWVKVVPRRYYFEMWSYHSVILLQRQTIG